MRLLHGSLVAGFLANAAFTNPERDLHHNIGPAVLGPVVVRLVWGLIGTRQAQWARRLAVRAAGRGEGRTGSPGTAPRGRCCGGLIRQPFAERCQMPQGPIWNFSEVSL